MKLFFYATIIATLITINGCANVKHAHFAHTTGAYFGKMSFVAKLNPIGVLIKGSNIDPKTMSITYENDYRISIGADIQERSSNVPQNEKESDQSNNKKFSQRLTYNGTINQQYKGGGVIEINSIGIGKFFITKNKSCFATIKGNGFIRNDMRNETGTIELICPNGTYEGTYHFSGKKKKQ